MGPYFGTDAEDISQALVGAYNPETYFDNDHVLALARFNSDFHIGCPTYQYAKELCESNTTVYLYEFAHYSAWTDPAAHISDTIPYSIRILGRPI